MQFQDTTSISNLASMLQACDVVQSESITDGPNGGSGERLSARRVEFVVRFIHCEGDFVLMV